MNRDLMRVLILAVLAFVLILTKDAYSRELKIAGGDIHSRVPEIAAAVAGFVPMEKGSMPQAVASQAMNTRREADGECMPE